MPPLYKLRYFNAMAAAEPIRWIFAYANIAYEDIRIEKENWPALKPTMPWNSLPVLEIDGQLLAQSSAIARYLGKKYGLVGDTEMEAAKCDEYMDAVTDLRQETRKYFFEQDEEKKQELKQQLKESTVPKYMQKFTCILEKNGSGYLVGRKVTLADIFVAHNVVQLFKLLSPEEMENFTVVQKHVNLVEGQPGIKEWINKRPQTLF